MLHFDKWIIFILSFLFLVVDIMQAEDISSISEDELNNLYNELKVTDDSAINHEENDIIWVDNSHLTVVNISENLLKSEKANKKEVPNDVIAIYESPVPAQLETYINQRDEYMNIVESTTTTEDLSYSAVEKSDSWDAAEKGPFFYAVISVVCLMMFMMIVCFIGSVVLPSSKPSHLRPCTTFA